jgi:hypothetical protein
MLCHAVFVIQAFDVCLGQLSHRWQIRLVSWVVGTWQKGRKIAAAAAAAAA